MNLSAELFNEKCNKNIQTMPEKDQPDTNWIASGVWPHLLSQNKLNNETELLLDHYNAHKASYNSSIVCVLRWNAKFLPYWMAKMVYIWD